MALADDLARIASVATGHAHEGETVVGVLACEPGGGARVYLCALGVEQGAPAWVALDEVGETVADRALVRDAVSIAALCEVAADAAFPGDLDELRAHLLQVRITEGPPGIEEAEAAAAHLQSTLGAPPQLATPARLDAIGAAARRLELALAQPGEASPFIAAMRGAQVAVEELWAAVEAAYRPPFE